MVVISIATLNSVVGNHMSENTAISINDTYDLMVRVGIRLTHVEGC